MAGVVGVVTGSGEKVAMDSLLTSTGLEVWERVEGVGCCDDQVWIKVLEGVCPSWPS